MNEYEVKALVQPLIENSTIIKIEDFDELYAVYFVNNQYYKSQKNEDLHIGNGPIFIEKSTKKIFETSSAQSIKEYVKAYQECGSIYGEPSNSILMYGLQSQCNQKQTIIDIKSICEKSMLEAKNIYLSLQSGDSIEVSFCKQCEANSKLEKLKECGVLAKILWRELLKPLSF